MLGLVLGAVTVIAGSIWIYYKEQTEFHIGYFIVLIVYGFTAGYTVDVLINSLYLVILSTLNKAEIIVTSTIIGDPNPDIIRGAIAIGALVGITVLIYFTWKFFNWIVEQD